MIFSITHGKYQSFNTLEELKLIPEVKVFSDRIGFHQFSAEHLYAMCSGLTKNYTYWILIAEFDNNDWWEECGCIFEATQNELTTLNIPEHDDWVSAFIARLTPPLINFHTASLINVDHIPPSHEEIVEYSKRLEKHKNKQKLK